MANRFRAARRLLTLAVLAPVAAACGDSTGPSQQPNTSLPRSLTEGETRAITASNDFAYPLLQTLYAEAPEANLFFSPLSVHLALGMALNGASGGTFEAMRTTLAFEDSDLAVIDAAYASLLELLSGLDPSVELQIGNSIWLRLGFPFHQSYVDTVRHYFKAEAAELDFADPVSLTTINKWVERATDGHIEDIVDRIEEDDVAFLVNAIYFNGLWTTEFDPSLTIDDQFTRLDGSRTAIRMMRREGVYGAVFDESYTAVELPYGGAAFTMAIVLPASSAELFSLVQSLDRASWEAILAGLTEQEIELQLPRFRLEWDRELRNALDALGMGVAFQGGVADFGNLSPDGRLYLSSVRHKSFVDVDETGTEAAAVTSVTVKAVCDCGPPTIRIDRPFLFAIRERLSGTILFLGVMVDPAGA